MDFCHAKLIEYIIIHMFRAYPSFNHWLENITRMQLMYGEPTFTTVTHKLKWMNENLTHFVVAAAVAASSSSRT